MVRMFFLIVTILGLELNAQVFYKVVAKDGSGNYRDIQLAINRVPENSTSTVRIFIKNGVYYEKLYLPATKKNVSLIGESADGVIISWNDYAGKDGISAADSYTFLVEGDDFYAENITVENTAGNVGQAIAIRTTGNRQVFKNCNFLGFQDTYYAHKNRQYNLHCFVEGATDFIYGDATAVYDSCTINCLSGGQYITAPADTKLTSTLPGGETFLHGLLFRNCSVARSGGVGDNTYYLGRPWQPSASSVYINCTLDDHIRPEGWSVWSGDNHLSSYFAEYQSRDLTGVLVDTIHRVDWSYQLSADMVDNYYTLDYFLKKDNVAWDPVPATIALSEPTGLTGESFTLTWTDVPDAIGYIIIRNDSAIGFSETANFTDETASAIIDNVYKIKSVSEKGNLSEASDPLSYNPLANERIKETAKEISFFIDGKTLVLDDIYNIRLYNLSGQLLINKKNVNQLALIHFSSGTYILVAEDNFGIICIKKFFID